MVEAIEGTSVTVHAKTNMPASMATLNVVNETPAPMEIASDDPTVLSGKFNVEKSGTYTIKFKTTGGQLNPNPVVYDIFAIPDRPPTAHVHSARTSRPSKSPRTSSWISS